MSFWRWLSGDAKRDKLLMAVPRLVPDAYKGVVPGDDRFIMTSEFAEEGNIYSRVYWFAAKSDDGCGWNLCMHKTTDVRSGAGYIAMDHICSNPLDVVVELLESEDDLKIRGFIPVPNENATYPIFAARNGIHFDANGEPFLPTADDTQTQKVILSGKALKAVFKEATAENEVLNTWGKLCSKLDNMCVMTDKDIQALSPQTIVAINKWLENAVENAETFIHSMKMPPAFCSDYGLRMSVACTSFALNVDAMARDYKRATSEGVLVSRDVLKSIDKHVKTRLTGFGEQYLDFSYLQIQQIKDIIPTGPRPAGLLPLERIAQRYAALEAATSAPIEPKRPKNRPPSA